MNRSTQKLKREIMVHSAKQKNQLNRKNQSAG